jgi:molybdenum storage protein
MPKAKQHPGRVCLPVCLNLFPKCGVRRRNSRAQFIAEISAADLLQMQIRTLPIEPVVLELLTRAKLATSIRIVNGLTPSNLTRALAGEPIGTLITA